MSGGNVLLAGAVLPLPLSWAARTHSGVSDESRWPAAGVCTRQDVLKLPASSRRQQSSPSSPALLKTLCEAAALLTSLGHVYVHFCFA